MLCASTSVGLFSAAMTCEAVNVLPVPVAPRRTCAALPSRKPLTIFSMACGWSPAGWNLLDSSNLAGMGPSS